MKTMSHTSNVAPGKLVELEEMLWEWSHIQLRSIRIWEDDAPWWYGERASISVLAGAIWRSGGIALEEYAVEKEQSEEGDRNVVRSGRNDLYFNLHQSDFILEAKSYWPNLMSDDIYTGLKNNLKLASDDVKQVKNEYGARRLAAVFIGAKIPKTKMSKAGEKINESLLPALNKFDNSAMAWIFPENARHLVSDNGYHYPGAAIVIQEVKSR